MPRSTPEKKPAPVHDWRTTDEDEIDRRCVRARDEAFTIVNTEARQPIFSNFRVASRSGLTYNVEIRDLRERQWACDCVDFRINGLGTCKHVEALLLHLQARHWRFFRAASASASASASATAAPLDDALTPPLSHALGEACAGLRTLLAATTADWRPVAGSLERLLA